VLSSFLRKIYQGFDTSNSIEAGAWREALRIIDKAAAEGVSQSAPSHEEDFLKELHRGNEIFAAFKVHSAGVQMAAKLLDEEGRLKPFDKWKSDVQSIASHQVGSWLHTEYDTAVLRAHYAADWRQFERDSDVMPNLRWMPTTSPNPEGAHKEYWSRKLTLPVGDSFWQRHHPQDRWNCKCSLEQTDDPVTEADEMDNVKTSSPQAGLDNNPGRDGRLFSDSHPYFPKSCAKCPFYKPSLKGRLKTLFINQKKDCYNCPYAFNKIKEVEDNGFILKKSYKNGGTLYVHQDADTDKTDYRGIYNICNEFAKKGHEVKITPRVHIKSPDYDVIYGNLKGTRYYGKCPDFCVNDLFYEFEGYQPPWRKKKLNRMITNGVKQSDRIVIDNNKGASTRKVKKAIYNHLNIGDNISELWVLEKGKIKLIYKKTAGKL
jgi:hypothetical protein